LGNVENATSGGAKRRLTRRSRKREDAMARLKSAVAREGIPAAEEAASTSSAAAAAADRPASANKGNNCEEHGPENATLMDATGT
jgi:hypothetical protein